jgi:hypothetical protein
MVVLLLFSVITVSISAISISIPTIAAIIPVTTITVSVAVPLAISVTLAITVAATAATRAAGAFSAWRRRTPINSPHRRRRVLGPLNEEGQHVWQNSKSVTHLYA